MGTPVCRGERLGEPLGLVVDAAFADGVHVAPVRLCLRMDEWIAVDLAGRGHEEPSTVVPSEFEQSAGTDAAHVECLDRQGEVVLW